jgi:hypothetical protein
MQLCSSGAVSQTWAYNAYLQIVLVSSQKPTRPLGMCLEAGNVPHTLNTAVAMQPCQGTTPSLYRQQWSFNDSSNLVGSKYDGSDVDGFCFNVQSANTQGSAIIITKTCGGSYDNIQTFSPDAKVGAGQASSAVGQSIGQLVNYNQFGRCLDDTGQNINATNMIAWPCKQNPNAGKVTWNQRYALPKLPSVADPTVNGTAANKASGTITTTYLTVVYCLQSPGATAVGQYVRTKLCDTSVASQQWTVYGKTDQYATSYEIVDSTGNYCLTPRDPNATTPDLYQTVNKISKIYVAVCDGSTLQKWNADKNVIDALALKDVNEQ